MPYHGEPCFSPYLVYHVSNGREERVKLSYSNPVEARFAVDIFRRLLVDYPKLTVYDRIAVITPYKSQVSTLRREFNKYAAKGWEKLVELSTVDGFQGVLQQCLNGSLDAL
jgi:senataxin